MARSSSEKWLLPTPLSAKEADTHGRPKQPISSMSLEQLPRLPSLPQLVTHLNQSVKPRLEPLLHRKGLNMMADDVLLDPLPGVDSVALMDKDNLIQATIHFLKEFLRDGTVEGDITTPVLGVIGTLEAVDEPLCRYQLRAASEAYQFVCDYLDVLRQITAEECYLHGFEKTARLLLALNLARQHEAKTGEITSYARIQDIYNELQPQ